MSEILRDTNAIRQALDDIFDGGIMSHGFTRYNRDYELIVQLPHTSDGQFHWCNVTHRFRACVEAHYTGKIYADMFPFDDIFIDYQRWEAAGSPEGWVWGVDYSENYPGATYVDDSARSALWTERLGVPMHEVHFNTNAYLLELVFHELEVGDCTPASSQP